MSSRGVRSHSWRRAIAFARSSSTVSGVGRGAFFLAMLADAVSGDCVMANEAELTHDRAEFGGDHQKAEGAESEGGVIHVDSFVS